MKSISYLLLHQPLLIHVRDNKHDSEYAAHHPHCQVADGQELVLTA